MPASTRASSTKLSAAQDLLRAAEPIWMPLLDRLPDVMCWIKDSEGRFVMVNETLAAAAGLPRENFPGKSDADIHPAEFAAFYREGDAAVMRAGRPLLDKPELVDAADGRIEWWLTSKFPLRDGTGRVIGTAGLSRRAGNDGPAPDRQEMFVRLLRFAREHVARKVAVTSLSHHMGISVATLERRTRAHFGTTPRRFLAEVRLGEAGRLLTHSGRSVAEIAEHCGYENHAAFSRAFRRRHGCTPGEYRRRALSAPAAGA